MPDAQGKLLPGEPGYTAPGTGLMSASSTGQNALTTGPTVTTYNPAQAQAKEAKAFGYDTADFTVKPEQTVQEQVRRVIGENSPLLQQAEARAREQANSRGLLNSSIAVGEGQKALYDTALPIAAADAATYERAGTNTTNALLASRAFKSGAENTASLTNAQLGTQANLSNQKATNDQLAQASDAALRQLMQTADNDTKTLLQSMSDKAALSRTQLSADTQLQIANIDQGTKKYLGQLDANNRQLLSMNAGLANMYQETVKNIAAIAVDSTMTPEAKKAATESQINLLTQGIRAAQSVSSTDQGALKSLNIDNYFSDLNEASASTDRQTAAGLDPNAIRNGDPNAVIAAANAMGASEWDGLLNVYQRGAPPSSGTIQQQNQLAEAVQRAQAA